MTALGTTTGTGLLRRQADGTYTGELRDRFGYGWSLTATVAEDGQGKHFALVWDLVHVPKEYRLPGDPGTPEYEAAPVGADTASVTERTGGAPA